MISVLSEFQIVKGKKEECLCVDFQIFIKSKFSAINTTIRLFLFSFFVPVISVCGAENS